MVTSDNLLAGMPADRSAEDVAVLRAAAGARIERIVSHGQASPPGFWYDQAWHEWVVVIEGRAGLRIEGEPAPRVLQRGDWIDLPAHCRHRVEWTDSPTVWLAVHYGDAVPSP